jgi:hypothetical protein
MPTIAMRYWHRRAMFRRAPQLSQTASRKVPSIFRARVKTETQISWNTNSGCRFDRGVITDPEIPMNSKLLASTLLAASLLGAPAFAQTSAPPDNTGPSGAGITQPAPRAMHRHVMSRHAMYRRHASMHRTHFREGTTTGMSSSRSRSHTGGESMETKKPSSTY